MAGLLSGIGQVLAGGVAGGAKAAGESFVEQAKQEALAAREENMLRIQNLFAKEGRKETQEFTVRMAGERVTHELGMAKTEKELKVGMAETERTFRVDLQKETNRLAIELEKASDTDARARIGLQYDNAIKLQDEAEKRPTEFMKKYNDIVTLVGGDKKRATELALYSVSGKKEEKALYAATMKGFIRQSEASGIPISKELLDDWKEISKEVSGLTESDFAGKPGLSAASDLDARLNRIKDKPAATKTVVPVAPLPLNEGAAFGALGEEGVPPGFSPKDWNDMSPVAKEQARKDYIAKRKARSTGLLENK